MRQWLPALAASFLFCGFAACYLVLLPIGFAQLSMVFCCLFFSVVLADVARLRQHLSRLRRQLAREDALLGRSRS